MHENILLHSTCSKAVRENLTSPREPFVNYQLLSPGHAFGANSLMQLSDLHDLSEERGNARALAVSTCGVLIAYICTRSTSLPLLRMLRRCVRAQPN